MAKERKRLKKQFILKYLILFAIVATVALINIYRIEQQKIAEDDYLDSTNQTMATDQEINADQEENQNSDAFIKQANLYKTTSQNEGKGVATISMSEDFFVH